MTTIFVVIRFCAGFSEILLLRVPEKIIASMGAFLGGTAYAALTGFHVPILRTLAMAALVLVAMLIGRRALSLHGLALAALGVMLITPESVPGPSFQMSFSAVLALIAGYEAMGRRIHAGGDSWRARLVRHVAALGFTSLLAGGASMPFAAYHFQQIQPYYILANLIAVPLMAMFILPLGMVSLLLMPLHLARFALIPMGWGIAVVLAVARLIGKLPHALILLPPFPGVALVVIAIGLVMLGLLRGGLRFAGVPLIGVGVVMALLARGPDLVVFARGNLTAVKGPDGVSILVAGRRDRFVLEQWRPLCPDAPVHVARADQVCAGGRCGFDRGRVLYLVDRDTAKEGYGAARVVISPQPLRGACRGEEAGCHRSVQRLARWRDRDQVGRRSAGFGERSDD